jgi:hypothetical protein
MQDLYLLYLDGRHIMNWTVLDEACKGLDVVVLALLEVSTAVEVKLVKAALLNRTMDGTITGSVPPLKTLALYNIAANGTWETVECTIKFEDGTYKEIE